MAQTFRGEIVLRNGWNDNQIEMVIPPNAFSYLFELTLETVKQALDNPKIEHGEKTIDVKIVTAIHFLISVFEADMKGVEIFYKKMNRLDLHDILHRIVKEAPSMPDLNIIWEEHLDILEALPVAD